MALPSIIRARLPILTIGLGMAITWTKELETGVKLIDDQHKELFARIDGFMEACLQGTGKEHFGEVVRFLEDYVIAHFKMEENYMEHYKFPEAIEHKQQHAWFVQQFKELKNGLEAERPGVTMLVSANRLLGEWLRHHIMVEDRKLGLFLKDRLNYSLSRKS